MKKLNGKKIAILATNGFEHSELFEPRKRIQDEGGTAVIVSPEDGSIKSWKNGNWGETVEVDMSLSNANPDGFDGLVIPGGVINPDILRTNENAIKFIQGFFEENKQRPVAAICHGPWLLAEAKVAKDRFLTSYSSIQTDMKNAGAKWSDEEVVVDRGIVTSRSPEDMPAFLDKMVEEMYEGNHKVTDRQVQPSTRN